MTTYDDYRCHIRSGDLIAFSNRRTRSLDDLISLVIRLVTRSDYNHIGIAWKIAGRCFIIEAVHPVVRIYPLSKLKPFYHIPTRIRWKKEYDDILMGLVGQPYSILEAIRGCFGKPDHPKQWQCAELVVGFYHAIGLDISGYTPSDVIYHVLQHFKTYIAVVK